MAELQTSANLPPRIAGKFARRGTVDLVSAKLAENDSFADVQLFSEKTLAQLLEVTPGALQHWRHEGIGPRWIRVGVRSIRYSRKDVAQWIADLGASQESKREDGC